ncbi:MAG: hypothetical protein QF790_11345 [Gammaproteobacteria bacterium]|nr:hypothetical protein [Gammaproteobacteria bacterium]MDP6617751.1 hypothetical protein [Gammaproteobacteria bacterium]MDP6694137.1 hypothetical protein [Gammaproteobacteria bacterium]
MSAYAFPAYVLAHAIVFGWACYLSKQYKAAGAPIIAIIAVGLVYDNLIVSLGTTIGQGSLLELLSLPRFYMHALLTPFMMIAVSQMAAAGGIPWAATRPFRVGIWLVVGAMVLLGAFEHLIGLELKPACFDGILRYTTNLFPSHFCFEGQEAVTGSGPPIPAIVGNMVTIVVGFALWRRNDWPWLLLGALVMFGAAGVPISAYGMAPSNAGEVVLQLSYVLTAQRFARGRVPPMEV